MTDMPENLDMLNLEATAATPTSELNYVIEFATKKLMGWLRNIATTQRLPANWHAIQNDYGEKCLAYPATVIHDWSQLIRENKTRSDASPDAWLYIALTALSKLRIILHPAHGIGSKIELHPDAQAALRVTEGSYGFGFHVFDLDIPFLNPNPGTDFSVSPRVSDFTLSSDFESALRHELRHVIDVAYAESKEEGYVPRRYGASPRPDEDYYSNPAEVKAFTTQLIAEVRKQVLEKSKGVLGLSGFELRKQYGKSKNYERLKEFNTDRKAKMEKAMGSLSGFIPAVFASCIRGGNSVFTLSRPVATALSGFLKVLHNYPEHRKYVFSQLSDLYKDLKRELGPVLGD